MTDKPNTKQAITIEELVMSNVYTQEALVSLLEKKGILTQKEVLDEVKQLQVEGKKKI